MTNCHLQIYYYWDFILLILFKVIHNYINGYSMYFNNT